MSDGFVYNGETREPARPIMAPPGLFGFKVTGADWHQGPSGETLRLDLEIRDKRYIRLADENGKTLERPVIEDVPAGVRSGPYTVYTPKPGGGNEWADYNFAKLAAALGFEKGQEVFPDDIVDAFVVAELVREERNGRPPRMVIRFTSWRAHKENNPSCGERAKVSAKRRAKRRKDAPGEIVNGPRGGDPMTMFDPNDIPF